MTNAAEESGTLHGELKLTDDGLETPEHLLGFTGQLNVRTPAMTMQMVITDPGLGEVSGILRTYPSADGYNRDLGDGEVVIYPSGGERRKYRVTDARLEEM